MKNFYLLIVFSFAIISSNSTQAQSHTDLIGKWQIDLNETVALMSVEAKSQLDSLDEDSRNQVMSGLSKQRFTFNADSTFLAGSMGAQFYDGKWNLISNELQLSFYNGASTSQQVTVPESNAIVLTISNSSSLFNAIYLKKSPAN